jgi:hypothetical protein
MAMVSRDPSFDIAGVAQLIEQPLRKIAKARAHCAFPTIDFHQLPPISLQFQGSLAVELQQKLGKDTT